MTEELSALQDFEPIHKTVGDLTLSLLTEHGTEIDPFTPLSEQLKLEVSRSGVKKTVDFSTVLRHLDEFKKTMKNLAEETPEEQQYECTACGDIVNKSLDAGTPYKCDCGNRKFEARSIQPINKMVADVRISIVLKDDEVPVLEMTNADGKKEIFYTVLGNLDELSKVIQQLEFPERDEEQEDFDIDRIESGISPERQLEESLCKIIQKLQGEKDDSVAYENIVAEAEKQDITEKDAKDAINRLKREGEIFEPQNGKLMAF